jgi:hypothetical protein
LLQIAFTHSVDDDSTAGEGTSHPSNFVVHDGKALAFLLGLAVTDAEDTSTDCNECESPPKEDDAPLPLLSCLVFQQATEGSCAFQRQQR